MDSESTSTREMFSQAYQSPQDTEAEQSSSSDQDAPQEGGAFPNDVWHRYVIGQVEETLADEGVEVKPEDQEWPNLVEAFGKRQSLGKLLRTVAGFAREKKSRSAGAGVGAATHKMWENAYKKGG